MHRDFLRLHLVALLAGQPQGDRCIASGVAEDQRWPVRTRQVPVTPLYERQEGRLEVGRHAPVAGVDQAYVIAAILEKPEPHDRQTYPLHGPVEMDHYGIAKAVSRALGIPVTYEPIRVEEFADGLASLGTSSHLLQHLSNVAGDYHNGVFQGTNRIEVIGNRFPMTVEEFVIDRRHVFDR
ncbi:hypothetical protein [Kitasatospora aureofaciens]|uniref:hypothetical protein n=1 Tax=Kitasatospora aureofaciens TaxID=1894 RepID=UPI001C48BB74|nr:hypothetical protein [Kitasatospora aureofaciens]MBV6696860.1 hypothetical protein [Kitasatospora aureofaciens]